MRNPMPVLMILLGIGILLGIFGFLPSHGLRSAPIWIAIFLALGCLGTGISLLLAERKFKIPPDNRMNGHRDHH